MIDYSISQDDDIIMEENDEFSVYFQNIKEPIWFSFDDIHKLKIK